MIVQYLEVIGDTGYPDVDCNVDALRNQLKDLGIEYDSRITGRMAVINLLANEGFRVFRISHYRNDNSMVVYHMRRKVYEPATE